MGALEAYCLVSERPVRWEAGDRCIVHGDAADPCDAGQREPQCTHPRLSPNHPDPTCSECGVVVGRVDVESMIDATVRRTTLDRRAYQEDPTHHARMRWLAAMLHLVDQVLTDEGIPFRTRERVTRCVLYGSPNPADALDRVDAVAAAVAKLRAEPPSVRIPVPPGWVPDPARTG